MNDEIIKLAREAGVCLTENDGRLEYFERFYELAVKAEREAFRNQVANDAHAMTFQSMGQYRTALLQFIRARTTP